MSYDDIMCRIEELVGDLYHEGYENGWNRCASQATHDYQDEWCDGFLTAWNASASSRRECRNVGEGLFMCSKCGASFVQEVGRGYVPMEFRYCPNCGAEVHYG